MQALQLTLPGEYYITLDGAAFSRSLFEIVARDEGAAVWHDLRTRLGAETLRRAFAIYYTGNKDNLLAQERDLMDAINAAAGDDWESYFTDMLFNIREYVREGWRFEE
jgi:hypothetical protein